MKWSDYFMEFLEQNNLPNRDSVDLAQEAKAYADDMIRQDNESGEGVAEDENNHPR